MKIKLTKLANQDLQSTKAYISQDNPKAALAVINRVIDAISHITDYPGIGRPGRVPQTKELVVSGTPLIIIYQIRFDTLYVVRIIHATRKWP